MPLCCVAPHCPVLLAVGCTGSRRHVPCSPDLCKGQALQYSCVTEVCTACDSSPSLWSAMLSGLTRSCVQVLVVTCWLFFVLVVQTSALCPGCGQVQHKEFSSDGFGSGHTEAGGAAGPAPYVSGAGGSPGHRLLSSGHPGHHQPPALNLQRYSPSATARVSSFRAHSPSLGFAGKVATTNGKGVGFPLPPPLRPKAYSYSYRHPSC